MTTPPREPDGPHEPPAVAGVVVVDHAANGVWAPVVREALSTPGLRCLVLVVDASGGWSDDAVLAVADASVPVVAVLRGRVTGHALAVALAADLRVATTEATVLVEPLVGGTSVTLPRVVGAAEARLLLLVPRELDAEAARARGLVHDVRPGAEVLAAARALAASVAERPGLGGAVRRALDRGAGPRDVDEAIRTEARMLAVAKLHPDAGPAQT